MRISGPAVTMLVAAAALAGCSEPRPAGEAPTTTVDTAFAVCAPPPDAGTEACACEDPNEKKARPPTAAAAAPAQTPAAIDPELRRFLRALGGACAAKDFALLAKSVRFPISWRAIVNENVPNGAPVTEQRRIRSPEELCANNAFAGIQGVDPAFPSEPLSIAENGPECRVTTLVGQFGASLVLEKGAGGWILVAIETGS